VELGDGNEALPAMTCKFSVVLASFSGVVHT
jgi:hypothetical protein